MQIIYPRFLLVCKNTAYVPAFKIRIFLFNRIPEGFSENCLVTKTLIVQEVIQVFKKWLSVKEKSGEFRGWSESSISCRFSCTILWWILLTCSEINTVLGQCRNNRKKQTNKNKQNITRKHNSFKTGTTDFEAHIFLLMCKNTAYALSPENQNFCGQWNSWRPLGQPSCYKSAYCWRSCQSALRHDYLLRKQVWWIHRIDLLLLYFSKVSVIFKPAFISGQTNIDNLVLYKYTWNNALQNSTK